MLRNMMYFYDQATHTVEASSGQQNWGKIRDSMADILYKLTSMKFEVCVLRWWFFSFDGFDVAHWATHWMFFWSVGLH